MMAQQQIKEDTFQVRYLEHQRRKRDVLAQIMEERHSNRMFAEKEIPVSLIDDLLKVLSVCPSSCDRKAITAIVTVDRNVKELLGGVLVGGVGWVHRAPVVILLFAAREAYKALGEVDYMPFLDAGVIVGNLYLAATAAGLHCCFINPNIREENKAFFRERFGEIFCGAFAFGWPKTL